ncbi:MAG: roadblock/LC7 domain-containing protein [Planctomycetes bacterium]|nr:roadblock/LC7 domain-containing protein [Planctomycetota bacterium]MCB9891785.1 roadblock/LC7 domain-containing protein [Planctomycetota bacterium]
MNDMEIVLRGLNEKAAAKGSVVVTNDGMVVAADMRKEIRKDIIGALSSFLISATDRCLRQGEIGHFGRMVMTATHGKVIIQSLHEFFLVVVVDQFADMELALEAVTVAGAKLRELTHIRI